MSSAQTVLSYAYASEVLMLLLCGMIIASSVINMEMYNKVGKVKGKDEEVVNNQNYIDMANKWFTMDTAVGAILAALILAMMTYQVGKGVQQTGDKGFQGSNIMLHIFSFASYAVIVLNCAYGLNVYKKTEMWVDPGKCKGQPIADRTTANMSAMQMRQKAMMAARARAMGAETPDDSAEKYAKSVNNTNIAFIVISSVIFAVYIGYLGYSLDYFKKYRGGARGGGYSEFFAYY